MLFYDRIVELLSQQRLLMCNEYEIAKERCHGMADFTLRIDANLLIPLGWVQNVGLGEILSAFDFLAGASVFLKDILLKYNSTISGVLYNTCTRNKELELDLYLR